MSNDKAAERQAKIDSIIKNLSSSAMGMDILMKSLRASGLSLMNIIDSGKFPTVTDPERLANAKKGVVLDTETTGLDHKTDEVIELAMVEFTYDEHGILALGRVYDEFNEPKKGPIPDEVVSLTGITNEMVKGHRIDPAEVKEIVGSISIVLAHNAAFDRKMCEANFPDCGFDNVDWHCTANQVEWIMRGKNGRSLEVLALSEGLVYGSHRANSDCLATAFVLNSKDENGRSAFAEMLERGNVPSIFLIAENAPFDRKDLLKDRGYRWAADGSEAYGYKAWHKEIPGDEASIAAEAEFMRTEVYKREVALPCYHVAAVSRYTDRKPGKKEFFRTAEVKSLEEASQQRNLEAEPTFDL